VPLDCLADIRFVFEKYPTILFMRHTSQICNGYKMHITSSRRHQGLPTKLAKPVSLGRRSCLGALFNDIWPSSATTRAPIRLPRYGMERSPIGVPMMPSLTHERAVWVVCVGAMMISWPLRFRFVFCVHPRRPTQVFFSYFPFSFFFSLRWFRCHGES
jgi:hypothetical protein